MLGVAAALWSVEVAVVACEDCAFTSVEVLLAGVCAVWSVVLACAVVVSPFGTVASPEGAFSAAAAALSGAAVWLLAGVLAVLAALFVAVAVWPTGALLSVPAVVLLCEAALFWSDCGIAEALLADWSAEGVVGVVAEDAEALWSAELVLGVAAAEAFWSVVLGFAAEAELLAAGAALEEAALWSLLDGVAAAALWSELCAEDCAVLLSHLSAIIFTSPETVKVLLSDPMVPLSCTWCPMCWSSFAVSPLSLYCVPLEFSV